MRGEEKATTTAPARLHVLLASEAAFAVILRRGPSKQVCTIGWNLDHDTFKLGQWLKGRIYEQLCDISPDGRHLLYHANQRRGVDGGYLEYSVLSRAPYLKAIKIWKNNNFYIYGGTFLDSHYLSLLGAKPESKIFRVSPFGQVKNAPELAQLENVGDSKTWQMQRGGWTLAAEAPGVSKWRKRLNNWQLELEIQDAYFPPKRQIYALHDLQSGETLDGTRWQWADIRAKRLLWAQDGKIFASHLWDGRRGPTQQLADFNDWTFEPVAAPY